MVRELRIVNMATKEELFLSEDTPPLVLDSVDWGNPVVSFSSYHVPFQIGEFDTGTIVGTREILLSGYVLADLSDVDTVGMSLQEYYRLQEQRIEKTKETLNSFFNVYQDVTIYIGDGKYNITGKPEYSAKYSVNYTENNEVLCYFTMSIMCFNPMFQGTPKIVDLSMYVKMFHFPLIIPEEEGIVFGEVFPRQVALAVNHGSVPVGCIIRMEAHGGRVKNPKLLNVNTGQYIGFDGVVLEDGERIVVTTNKGEENAIKRTASDELSLVGNMAEGSTFLQIAVGEEYYYYDMDGSEANLYTTMEYNEVYFNMAVM